MKKTVLILFVIFSSWSIRCNNSIHVEQYGKGSPVIILAGLGGTEVWQHCLQTLAAENTCYVISVKGLHGDKNKTDPDFIQIEAEIMDTLQKMNISNPVLMGHSFGGFLAMQLASNYPSAFDKLILVDAYPFTMAIYNPAFTRESGIQQSLLIRKQLTDMPEAGYQAFWSQNVQQFTSDTLFQKTILQKITGSERKFVVEAQSFVLSNDIRTEIQKIQCPVHVICSSYLFKKAGLGDDIIRQRITEQFATIGNCNIFIHDQARHFLMLDAEGWFLDNIQKIINNQ